MKGTKLLVLVIAALALLAAGCGGDDGDSEASSDTAVVETDTATEDTTSEATATESTDDVTAALGGECTELAGLSSKVEAAFGSMGGDLDSASQALDELADQVPEEIRDDYQVLADNFKEFADALQGVDLSSGETPSPEVIAKLQQAAASMDEPAVQEASKNIEAWVQANC